MFLYISCFHCKNILSYSFEIHKHPREHQVPSVSELQAIGQPVDRADVKARVISGLQTNVLPNGSVEFGVVCVIIDCDYFGDARQFLVVNLAEDVPKVGAEVWICYYVDYYMDGSGLNRFAFRSPDY